MRTSGLAAAWMFVLAGCSSCTPRPSPDASPSDASDAAVSAEGGPQTCSQAPGDPSFRCDLVTSAPGWKRISCLPACGIEIADDPARSDAPSLSWQPCADGRAGCTELNISPTDFAQMQWSFSGAFTENRPLLWVYRTSAAGGAQYVHLFDLQTGEARFAERVQLRNPAECQGLPLAVHSGRALTGFMSWLPQAPYSGRIEIELSRPPTVATPRIFDYATCGSRFAPTDCALTSAGMTCISSDRRILRWDDTRPKPEWLSSYAMLNGVPAGIESVNDDVWFTTSSWDFDLTVRVISASGDVRRIAPAPGGDAFGFASDGVEMAWLEGVGRDRVRAAPPEETFQYVTLVRSDYASSPENLRRRVVGRVPDLRQVSSARLGSGFFAYWSTNPAPQPPSITVVRLSDGSYWRLHAGAGYQWGSAGPHWIGGGEIALTREQVGMTEVPVARAFQRIRLDALGPAAGVLPAM